MRKVFAVCSLIFGLIILSFTIYMIYERIDTRSNLATTEGMVVNYKKEVESSGIRRGGSTTNRFIIAEYEVDGETYFCKLRTDNGQMDEIDNVVYEVGDSITVQYNTKDPVRILDPNETGLFFIMKIGVSLFLAAIGFLFYYAYK
ncbi:DUF3592 domain-containing protein [Vallitalea okinawensis]|uniref:DUF3592 domain-containing protein n=1 Tax=Vallitalea okinawensis TaxID=2078660 RepID=UPI0013003CB8|nr:DUF3592 domain-containing protein [Vallitalea okinawensis]